MMLVLYEAALAAMAAARSVDEVKDIRDKAAAMAAYARMAKDNQLELDAAEIRIRATRRVGEMMAVQPKAAGGQPYQSTGVSKTPVERPATLAETGIDKNLAKDARGCAAIPKEKFEGMLADWRARLSAENEPVIINPFKTADTTEAKKERRAARERELANKQLALPTRKYGVIVADPEWRFEPYSRETGMDRAADNHYPTSALEVIKSRDVASIAADDCVLFFWATAPMLPQALSVMDAWGFEYR
jgi:hypothetical protein